MPLLKAYIGPVGTDGFELVVATLASVTFERTANIDIQSRDGVNTVILRRVAMSFSAEETLLPGGGVLRTPLTLTQYNSIIDIASYTRIVEGVNFYYLLPTQLVFTDLASANVITSTDLETTSSITVDSTGLYEVTVTDATGLTDLADDSVELGGDLGLALSGPPQFILGEDIMLTAVARDALHTITSASLTNEAGMELFTATQVAEFTGAIADTQVSVNVTYTPTVTETFTLTVNDGTTTIVDTLAISRGNDTPEVLITSDGVTPNNNEAVVFTAVVTDNNLVDGIYIWFVDGFRRRTNTHPSNTFSYSAADVTSTITCTFSDVGGLTGTSNVISVTWS